MTAPNDALTVEELAHIIGLIRDSTTVLMDDDLDRVEQAAWCGLVGNERLKAAATALIADVRRRHPGEELHCPYMQALDAALLRC